MRCLSGKMRRPVRCWNLWPGRGRPIVDLFRFPFDCHNAKVLLKGSVDRAGRGGAGNCLPCGSVPEETMREALRGKWCQGAAGMAAPLALPKRATPGQKAAALSCWMRRWIVLCTAE